MELYSILQTKDSRINFLKGLIRVAKSDSVIDEKEQSFYAQSAYAMGLGQEEILMLEKYKDTKDKIEVLFDSNKEKMFFLIQVIQLCWVDGEYTDAEKAEIRCLAEEMGISRTALKVVEDWAYEGIKWNKRGDELLLLN